MKGRILAFCLALVLMFSATGCGAKSDVKELIGKLETACNDMDVSGILDCVNPDKVAPIKLLVDTIGEGSEALVSYVYEFLGITVTQEESEEEPVQTIVLKPTEYVLEDDRGTVTCTLSFEMGDSTVEKEIVLDVIKVDDVWYIDGLE